MSDASFSNGPWKGFYLYGWSQGKHWMELSLTLKDGKVMGGGIDDVGRFTILGRLDEKTGAVTWVKTYPGSHDVFYDGCLDVRGIWGHWTIPPLLKGGFHIWPIGRGAEASVSEKADAGEPVDATTYLLDRR